MRDKAKPPSLGLSSLSDKIKSLQNLIENSKRKNIDDIEDIDTPPSITQSNQGTDTPKSITQPQDSANFDWQNIELTNELGTDFRSTLTGGVPLEKGSIAPELDPQNPDLDDADIPTLETVVFKPSPAAFQQPAKKDSIPVDAIPKLESSFDSEQPPIPESEQETDDTDFTAPEDDLSEPTRPETAMQETVSSIGAAAEPTPGFDSEPYVTDNTEPEHDLSDPTRIESELQKIESSIDPVSDSTSELNSESYDAETTEPEDDLSIPTLTDSVISDGQFDVADNSEAFTMDPASAQATSDNTYRDEISENVSGYDASAANLDEPTVVNSEASMPRPLQDSYLVNYSEITDEILLIIENRLREITGRTLHPDVLEAIHEDLHDLLRDWQEQLESKSD